MRNAISRRDYSVTITDDGTNLILDGAVEKTGWETEYEFVFESRLDRLTYCHIINDYVNGNGNFYIVEKERKTIGDYLHVYYVVRDANKNKKRIYDGNKGTFDFEDELKSEIYQDKTKTFKLAMDNAGNCGYIKNGNFVAFKSQADIDAAVSAAKIGNAAKSDVLSGKTFTNSSTSGETGTMANNGAWTSTPTSAGNVTIPQGYHNGSGYVNTNSVYNKGKSDGAYNGQATMVNLSTSDDKTFRGSGTGWFLLTFSENVTTSSGLTYNISPSTSGTGWCTIAKATSTNWSVTLRDTGQVTAFKLA